jgi:hypothetical protein
MRKSEVEIWKPEGGKERRWEGEKLGRYEKRISNYE